MAHQLLRKGSRLSADGAAGCSESPAGCGTRGRQVPAPLRRPRCRPSKNIDQLTSQLKDISCSHVFVTQARALAERINMHTIRSELASSGGHQVAPSSLGHSIIAGLHL